MNENGEYKAIEMCDCGFSEVALSVDDNDHLCQDCRTTKKDHGWCMAHAARNANEYGPGWTVAQANAQRERIEQPNRKHTGNRRGWW